MHLIRAVESLCCSFLWKENVNGALGARVCWDQICRPNSEGGLGLKRASEWNKACLARLIWLLFQGLESLWIAWVKEMILRGKCFWAIDASSNFSWTWRRLLKLRSLFRPYIAYKVGNGDLVHLWTDMWHPKSPLRNTYGLQAVYSLGYPLHAKLSFIINNSCWSWPPIRYAAVADIIHLASPINPGTGKDVSIWLPTKHAQFTVSSAWIVTRSSSPKVPWAHVIWFKGAIPKYSFISWLEYLDRLPTKMRILKYNAQQNPSCEFCGDPESRDHLFFSCCYSALIWKNTLGVLGKVSPPSSSWSILAGFKVL